MISKEPTDKLKAMLDAMPAEAIARMNEAVMAELHRFSLYGPRLQEERPPWQDRTVVPRRSIKMEIPDNSPLVTNYKVGYMVYPPEMGHFSPKRDDEEGETDDR